MAWYRWKPYVPVAKRRAQARRKMEKLRKQGLQVQPVEIEGRKIARTFWGEAWCDHLESFSDYENRLPRGRTYVRNGSVCHLAINKGNVQAIVSGSELYDVAIKIKTLNKKKWAEVTERCAGQVGSLLELLQGKLSKNVMEIVTDRTKGLFPPPREINFECSCPDWAVMCKHVAAALYGVGARLDEQPDLLFLLRGVDHQELISAEVGVVVGDADAKGRGKRLAEDELSDLFGIEMSEEEVPVKPESSSRRKKSARKPSRKSKAGAKKSPKHKKEPVKKATQRRQKPAKRGARAKAAAQRATNSAPVTGAAVAKLRAKLGLSKSEFARLLGVSVPSITNWEKKPGPLNLRDRTLEGWNSAKELTKQQAARRLNRP